MPCGIFPPRVSLEGDASSHFFDIFTCFWDYTSPLPIISRTQNEDASLTKPRRLRVLFLYSINNWGRRWVAPETCKYIEKMTQYQLGRPLQQTLQVCIWEFPGRVVYRPRKCQSAFGISNVHPGRSTVTGTHITTTMHAHLVILQRQGWGEGVSWSTNSTELGVTHTSQTDEGWGAWGAWGGMIVTSTLMPQQCTRRPRGRPTSTNVLTAHNKQYK